MNYDTALKTVGEFGTFQKRLTFLVCFCAVPTALSATGYLFWAATPDHWCKVPDHYSNQSVTNATSDWIPRDDFGEKLSCYIYDADDGNQTLIKHPGNETTGRGMKECDEYEFDKTYFHSTLVTKWKLVCSRSYLKYTTQSVFMVGYLLGTLFTGMFVDRYGRRIMFLITSWSLIVLTTITPFAPEIYTFMALRLLSGMMGVSSYTIGMIILAEFVGPNYRTFVVVLIDFMYSVGFCVTCLVAYFIRDGMILQLSLTLPFVVLIHYYWTVPESPRWLLSQGRYEEALTIIGKIAKTNNTRLDEDQKMLVEKKGTTVTICHVVTYPNLRRVVFILFFLWMTISGVYWGMSMISADLGDNPYLAAAANGFAELPAGVWAFLSMQKLGRIKPFMGTLVVSGVALLLALAVPAGIKAGSIILASVGKFAVTAAFTMAYLVSTEVGPTPARAQVVMSGSFAARIAGIVSPYSSALQTWWSGSPLLLFGVLSLIAASLTMLLPNTWKRKLPQTVEDAEELCKMQIGLCGKTLEINSESNDDEDQSSEENVKEGHVQL